MQFKQYPSYKNSGVEWLGDVPEHWGVNRLGVHFKNRKEKVSDKDFKPLSVTKHGIVPQLEHAAKSDNGDNRKLVRKGDYVINSRSDRKGSSGLADLDGSVSLINIVLTPFKTIHPKFSHYLLRSYLFQEEFYKYGHGIVADLWTTNYEDMRNIHLALPSVSEQTQISNFLEQETTRIDNLIAKQEKLIELLEEQRKSIISHAVTKGLNPNAPMKDSGVEWLGEVPEHWNLKPIKFLAKTNQLTLAENTDENFEIQYVDIGSVSRTNGIEKIETILFKDAPSRARRIVKDGDIIVSTVRTYLKAIAYIENPPKNLIVSTGFAVLNPIRTVISPQYAKFTFLAEQFIAEVIAKSKGISYPAITATELADIKIALPPLNEQKVILQYLLEENLKMNKLISKQNQLIEKLKEYRASIISHAVTGKIDVREFGT
jgi:type I restriction enzyme S subunit